MSYFSSTTHTNVCLDPTTLPTLYSNTRTTYINSLPSGLQGMPESINKMGWATCLAFDLKPYGPGNGVTLTELLSQTSLNCDDYCRLTIEIYKIINPSGTQEPKMIGWHNGSVGNHAQILFWSDGYYLMCDPTIGMIVRDFSLTGMCRGYPPVSNRWATFWSYNSAQRQNIASFEQSCRDALLNGTYYADHFLYYFPSLDAFNNQNGGSSTWATPQSWNI